MIPIAACMALLPEYGYPLIMTVLSVGLIINGFGSLFYFFTMARFMVGGKRSLYIGIIVLDLGLFTVSIADIPRFYIMLYLIGIHAFSGFVEIMAARNAKKLGDDHWKLKFSQGLVNVIIAIICLTFIRTKNTAVYIYCAGMAYSGITKMLAAFRKTAMVYIQ